MKLHVDAPWTRDCPIETVAWNLNIMREQLIKDLIDALAAEPNWEDFDVQCQCYDRVGIDSDTLTPAEEEYIVHEVMSRRNY